MDCNGNIDDDDTHTTDEDSEPGVSQTQQMSQWPETPPKSKKIKRVTYYNQKWEASYNWLKQGSTNTEALCKTCSNTFSVSFMGLSAVKKHASSTSHQKKSSAANLSQVINNFFCKKDTEEELKVILIEVCKIYHNVKHNQSYNSLDCAFKLDKTVYADSKIACKLSCGRTKSEAIVQNVLAEKALENVLLKLENHNPKLFYCIQLDASNRKNVKLFPISIQFFTITDGLQNYLLEFSENPDETANGMYDMVNKCVEKLKLDWKHISCLSADNTNSNFGENHSLYTNMKTKKNKHILKANCHAHIIHNCVKYAMDVLKLDIENLVLKIYSYFSCSAKRREELKQFHEFVDCKWRELIRHVGTRWLSLNCCIERILLNYKALTAYFLSIDNCPKQIQNLLKINDDSTEVPIEIEIYLFFVNHVLDLFENCIKQLECNETTALDVFVIMTNLRSDLQNRLENKFYGYEARLKLKELSETNQNILMLEFDQFFIKSLEYLEKRFNFQDDNILKKMSDLNLKDGFPVYETFENVVLNIKNENLVINLNELFNEIMVAKEVYKHIKQENDFFCLSTPKKWQKLLQNLDQNVNTFKIISFLLSIPATSAFSERVFSVMNIKWRDERNKCSAELIRSELLIYFNFKESCKDFYESAKNDTTLLKAAKSNQKYKFKNL